MTLDYRIDLRRPAGREVFLELEFEPDLVVGSGAAGIELFMPSWTPGSYLVREFSKHIGSVAAVETRSGRAIPLEKTAKNRFRVPKPCAGQRVRISWSIYAHELSVRTADLTGDRAFWNHACLLLWPVGCPSVPARLTVVPPEGWQVVCALPREATASAGAVGEGGQITLLARDLDHAMDSPCLCGRFERLRWEVAGVVHEAVFDGLGGIPLPSRLPADLASIVTRAAAVFGGELPYASYLFLCLFAAEGHGGLEHADSTTLLMSRTAFVTEKGYREFLSLAAHELFHAWNVKRMRPVEFWRYDYESENYTEFLWLIEGWTAYYDDLLCLRAGVFTRAHYLEAAAKNINGMLAAPGRFRLSLRASSFDAWIRLYRPDENTRNSSQNYYGNGAVAGMCLDLWLRRETGGVHSLDDVVRGLYESTFRAGRGYQRADVERVLAAIGGQHAVGFLSSLIDGQLDPPLGELLSAFGVQLKLRDTDRPWLGVHFDTGATTLASVTRDSPAFHAGLHPGDEILAIDKLRIDSARWADLWSAIAKIGRPLPVVYSRRGILGSVEVLPTAAPGSVLLEIDAGADSRARELLGQWLPEVDRPSVSATTSAPAAATS